jgi:hypothetical protein
MSKRTVAIHQPNFFPWLGFFDKIQRADVFVVLDHVQFPKSEGNWSNRVKMAVNGEAAWVTMPVARDYEGFRRIDEMRIDNRSPWRRKLLQLLRTNYGRAAAFREVFPAVEAWVATPAELVADYNITVVSHICAALNLRTDHMVRSSTLAVAGAKSELVANLVTKTGGTVYLSGDGSGGYLDEAVLHSAGVSVEYQRFIHPVYAQRPGASFVAGLSVLDALFHLGFDGTARLFAGARGQAPAAGR